MKHSDIISNAHTRTRTRTRTRTHTHTHTHTHTANGALQYFVEVSVGSRLQYAGPCMLEVKDEDLTVKTKDGTANLVRWKLAHIRSFKAKKDVLTVYSGRSVSGQYVES